MLTIRGIGLNILETDIEGPRGQAQEEEMRFGSVLLGINK